MVKNYLSLYSLAWPLSIIASGIIIPFLTINLGWEFLFYFIISIHIMVMMRAMLQAIQDKSYALVL